MLEWSNNLCSARLVHGKKRQLPMSLRGNSEKLRGEATHAVHTYAFRKIVSCTNDGWLLVLMSSNQ